jgi:hypothetical protein
MWLSIFKDIELSFTLFPMPKSSSATFQICNADWIFKALMGPYFACNGACGRVNGFLEAERWNVLTSFECTSAKGAKNKVSPVGTFGAH